MTPTQRHRALTRKKIVTSLAALAVALSVGVAAAAPSQAGQVAHNPNEYPLPNPPSTGTLATKTKAEWNLWGVEDCLFLGCTWLWTPVAADNCQVHHIIPQNDPRAEFAREYANAGGWSTEDLGNGVYITYAEHVLTLPATYYTYQEALFRNMEAAPGGNTPAGARYYVGIYLNQSKMNLRNAGGCRGWTVVL